MPRRDLGFSVVVVLVVAMHTPCWSSAPRSLAELLRQHGVDLSKASLLNALRSPDAEVRQLAANKLAEDKAQDAIPAIEEALAVEQVAATRINIAFALAELGDEKGFTVLRIACNDADLPGYLRTRATTGLLQLHREHVCLNAVLEMLQSNADPLVARIPALSLVPSFQHVSKEDSQKIFDLVVKALADPAVRMEAGIALGRLGDSSAIPYLETAIANEQDEVIRSRLQDAVQSLQDKRTKESPK